MTSKTSSSEHWKKLVEEAHDALHKARGALLRLPDNYGAWEVIADIMQAQGKLHKLDI